MNQPQVQDKPIGFQKPTKAIEILVMDMLTPIGADIAQTAASVGAGISAYQSTSHINKQQIPMTMALVPDEALPPLEKELLKVIGLTGRQQRMLRLATLPLQQLADEAALKQPIPLLLAGPEKLPGRRSVIGDKFLMQLKLQTGFPINLENSFVFPHGRAAGFYALEAAMLMIEQGMAQQVIVGAVDSYLDLQLLGSLDDEDRILAEGVMDGFAPAEAAAFMLVQAATENSRVRIYPPGISKETGHRYSKEPYKGEGLAAAVSEAVSPLETGGVKTVLAGFNGEHFNAKEWGVSMIRNNQMIDPDFAIVHPADCLGDCGASLGLVLTQLAALGLEKGHYQGPVLAWCSSELAQRGAVCLA